MPIKDRSDYKSYSIRPRGREHSFDGSVALVEVPGRAALGGVRRGPTSGRLEPQQHALHAQLLRRQLRRRPAPLAHRRPACRLATAL